MQQDSKETVSHTEKAAADYWQRATRRLTRHINLGWWLTGWIPLAVVTGLLGMVMMLYGRWRVAGAASWVWGGIVIAMVATALFALWRGRRRFESQAASQVRLEEAFGLHARLTAASEGVGPWPERPEQVAAVWPIVWRWQRPVAALGFIALMLGLSAWVPIAGAVSQRTYAIEKPADARILEQWIEELKDSEVIDEKSAEEVERKIEELTERPKEEWYEHASLEAAGTLKEQTASAIQEMADNMTIAAEAAETLQAMQDSLPQALRESLVKDLEAAIQGLELGAMRPDIELSNLLSELKSNDLRKLTPEQIKALAKCLEGKRAKLCKGVSNCKGLKLSECRKVSNCLASGKCIGTARGRADAELSVGEENNLGTTRLESIAQEIDLERAVPFETLAVLDAEHDVDESAYTGPTAGGDIASEGDGGAAVQIDVLLPSEQAALKRFFE